MTQRWVKIEQSPPKQSLILTLILKKYVLMTMISSRYLGFLSVITLTSCWPLLHFPSSLDLELWGELFIPDMRAVFTVTSFQWVLGINSPVFLLVWQAFLYYLCLFWSKQKYSKGEHNNTLIINSINKKNYLTEEYIKVKP